MKSFIQKLSARRGRDLCDHLHAGRAGWRPLAQGRGLHVPEEEQGPAARREAEGSGPRDPAVPSAVGAQRSQLLHEALTQVLSSTHLMILFSPKSIFIAFLVLLRARVS